MKKLIPLVGLGCWLLLPARAEAASVTVDPWVPVFKGIELAAGHQQAQSSGEIDQEALCLRVDLTDPDIVLFTTPKCTNCALDTLAENCSYFLEEYGVQAAINGAFYSSSTGPNDTPLGTPDDVRGLTMCTGVVVSAAATSQHVATLMFRTNNEAVYIPNNTPPTNTTGFFTAISGNIALLQDGINLRSPTPNDLDPRTALGLSADRRYLYLMTIDGRQSGWSNGADFYATGEWLKRFGASDGINVDGGGSTTMSLADCQGRAQRINRSSFVAAYGRERNTGHNFGVYAKPLPTDLKELAVDPGTTSAVITWRTEEEGTTQVEYGASSTYGNATPLDERPLKNHVAVINDLVPGSNYFFRAISTVNGETKDLTCGFATGSSIGAEVLFGLSKSWRYTTNNQDMTNWKLPGFDDGNWSGPGPGLLYIENSASVGPKGTAVAPHGQTISRTHYFRTHFTFNGNKEGATLVFSNYVDDGAVFYLNGAEIYRLRVASAPTVITYSSSASGSPCAGQPQSGDALPSCPDVFSLTGTALAGLVEGDNVSAVEVHNSGTLTPGDMVFGMALLITRPSVESPHLNLWWEGETQTLFWNASGFTLQQSVDLTEPAHWMDVPGPITSSPVVLTNMGSIFYRLRN